MYKRTSLAVLALAAFAGACDRGLTEINENPNEPTDVSVEFLLPAGQKALVDQALGSNFGMTLTDLWVQHLAKVQYIDEDRYELRPGTVDAHFRDFYRGPLMDFEMVIRKGEEAQMPNWIAVGRIMKAYTFSLLTDHWGDVPYSEALKGDVNDNNTPAYDTQKEIYYDLLKELTEASAQLSAGGGTFRNGGDLLYDSDHEAWRRFANSLRMRLAMRLSAIEPAKAQAEFLAAHAAGGFTSNDHNAVFAYARNKPDQNPRFVFFETRLDHTISKTVVDTLRNLDDPRLPVYATLPPAERATGSPDDYTLYRGMPNGMSDAHGIAYGTALSRIGDYFLAPDAPAVIQSYAEVLFLKAEAAHRGWLPGGAAAAAGFYNDAIRASMQMYGIGNAAVNAYLAQPRVQYAGLESIALQKWIALFGNGPEAYAEWRRFNAPALVPGPANSNSNRVPVRLPYPDFEQSLNAANLQAAVSRNGGMTLNDRVWWDAS